MRTIYCDGIRSIKVEDLGAFWAVYERSYCLYDPKDWVYKGYTIKMSETRQSLVDRCKQCIRNHDRYRPIAVGIDGLPIRR